jgi:hypothetical protein
VYVDYFKNHEHNEKMFHNIYYHMTNLLQLTHFLDIFDYIENIELIEFILQDTLFHSLFISSLEMQKFVFTRETLQNSDDEPSIVTILKKEPYKMYVMEIMKGNTGEEYAQKTIGYLKN